MFQMHIPKFRTRMVIMLLGVFGMGFFVSFLIELRLGIDPFGTFCLGMSERTGLLYGTMLVICNGLLFFFQLWRGRHYIGFGTLANMILIGYISDFFRFLWARLLPDGIFLVPAVRWSIFLPVLFCFVVSAACYIAAGVGVSPCDSLPGILTELFPRLSYTPVRFSIDILFVIGALLTGTDVGIVTALMAFCIAPVLAAVRRLIERIFLADGDGSCEKTL